MREVIVEGGDSIKFQVSFAKEPYKTDDILQEKPIIVRSLLIVGTPRGETTCHSKFVVLAALLI